MPLPKATKRLWAYNGEIQREWIGPIRCPRHVVGSADSGTGKADWEGIGDAVLIDGQRRIVAVADGPERNPEASSGF